MTAQTCADQGPKWLSGSATVLSRALVVMITGATLMACSPFEDIKDRLNPPKAESHSPAPESPTDDSPDSTPAPTPQPDPAPGPGSPEEPAAGPAPLALSSQELPLAIQDVAYDAPIAVSGGIAPIQFELVEGTLPEGLRFDAGTGRVSGTTTALGTYEFRVSVRDSSENATELEAVIRLNVSPPPTNVVEVANGTAAAAAAGFGLQSGLLLTMARGPGIARMTDLDWEKVDYGTDLGAVTVNGGLDSSRLNLAKIAAENMRILDGGQATALWASACEFDGWLWVDRAGDLKLRLTNVRDLARLYFDGEEVAYVPENASNSDTITIAGAKRGFHRVRYVHLNRSWDVGFNLQMAEGGDAELATIAADRFFHGPAALELPLLERTAVEGFEFRYQLRKSGVQQGAVFSVAGGALPAGISLTEGGELRGTPTESGTHYFVLRIANASGVSSLRRLALHVLGPVGTGTRNDADVTLLDFESGGSADLPGYAATPFSQWGNGWLKLDNTKFYFQTYWSIPENKPVTDSVRVDADVGVLDGKGSLYSMQTECGFYFQADQGDRIGDRFPAARTANRFGVFFHLPDRARSLREIEASQTADPSHFRVHALETLHLAGFNAPRFDQARKEIKNYHYYHPNSGYWPGNWPIAKIRHIGDGWWYYETSDQSAIQRTGEGRRAGLYNPIEEIGREYIDTLSIVYVMMTSGARGVPANTYPDGGEFRIDKLRMYREQPTVDLRTRDDKRVYRVAVANTANVVDAPFKVTSSASETRRFKISRLNGNVPIFDGAGVWLDANANGRIDDGDTELAGEYLTPSFAPGETKNFVYRVDIGGVPTNTTAIHGVTLRVLDPKNVLTLDGDSLQFFFYKCENPGSVETSNIFAATVPTSKPEPTGAPNNVPQVTITQSSTEARVGESVTFAGTAVDDDGPAGTRPYWDFGDASEIIYGRDATHVFTRPGTYRVRLYACDLLDRGYAEVTVTVTE